MDALPMIGELTSAVPRPLEHALEREAWQLEREGWQLVREAWQLVRDLGIVEVMHRYWGLAVAGCVGMFLILYGVHLARASTSQDVSIAKVRVLGTMVAWRGPAAVGCMLGGIAVLLLALWKNQLQ